MFGRLTAISAVTVVALVTVPAHAAGNHRQQPAGAGAMRLTPATFAESLLSPGASPRTGAAAPRGAPPQGAPPSPSAVPIPATVAIDTSAAVSPVGDFTGDGVREV